MISNGNIIIMMMLLAMDIYIMYGVNKFDNEYEIIAFDTYIGNPISSEQYLPIIYGAILNITWIGWLNVSRAIHRWTGYTKCVFGIYCILSFILQIVALLYVNTKTELLFSSDMIDDALYSLSDMLLGNERFPILELLLYYCLVFDILLINVIVRFSRKEATLPST